MEVAEAECAPFQSDLLWITVMIPVTLFSCHHRMPSWPTHPKMIIMQAKDPTRTWDVQRKKLVWQIQNSTKVLLISWISGSYWWWKCQFITMQKLSRQGSSYLEANAATTEKTTSRTHQVRWWNRSNSNTETCNTQLQDELLWTLKRQKETKAYGKIRPWSIRLNSAIYSLIFKGKQTVDYWTTGYSQSLYCDCLYWGGSYLHPERSEYYKCLSKAPNGWEML